MIPILGVWAEIVGEFLAREYSPGHPHEHDLGRNVEIERLLGVMNEVDAEQVAHLLVIPAPSELHEAAPVIGNAGFGIDLAVFLVLAFSIFLDAAERAIGFVMRGRQRIGEPAVILLAAVGFPVVESRREAGDGACLERAVEKVLARIVEKELIKNSIIAYNLGL